MRMQIWSMLYSPYVQNLLQLQASAPVFDPNTFIEYGGSGQSQKWAANGIALGITYDGTHPNSYSYAIAAPALQASLFPSIN
jgi:hypothetical protein